MKVATASANSCDGPLAALDADRERRQIEHQMRDHGAGDAAGALHGDIRRDLAPAHVAARRKHQRHRRIEMRAGDRGRKW